MIKRLFQYSIILVSLLLIIHYFFRHTSDLFLITKFKFHYLAILTSLIFLSNLVTGYKLFVLLNHSGLRAINYIRWIKIFLISRLLNFHITQGANIYRAVKLKKEYHFAYSKSVAIIVFVTCFDIAIVLLITAFIILISRQSDFYIGLSMLAFVILIPSLIGLTPYVSKKMSYLWAFKRNERVDWLLNRMNALTDVFISCIRNPSLLAFIFVMCILVFLIYLISIRVCLLALGEDILTSDLVLFTSFFILSRTINIVPNNFGISELICGISSDALIDGMGHGIIISVIFRLINYFVLGLVALVFNKELMIKDLKSYQGKDS